MSRQSRKAEALKLIASAPYVSQFFDPDSPSGEPVLNQVRDPFTEAVYGPGMKVDSDGAVTFLDDGEG
jgi:hypothetical protein